MYKTELKAWKSIMTEECKNLAMLLLQAKDLQLNKNTGIDFAVPILLEGNVITEILET